MTITQIAVTAVAGGAVLAALIGVLQGPLRVVLGQITCIFISQKSVEDAYTIRIITDFLNRHAKRFSFNRESFEAFYRHVRPLGEERNVFYRIAWSSNGVWLFRGRPIILIPGDGTGADSEAWIDKATFLFLRGTVDWNKLVKEAADERDSEIRNTASNHKRFTIIKHWSSNVTVVQSNKTSDGHDEPETRHKHQSVVDDPGDPIFWNRDDIGPPVNEKAIGVLSLTPSMEGVVDRVKFWFHNKTWYKERGISWKLGVLIYGPPGNGKTSLVRAICEELDLPMHVMDMSEMDSDDLTNAWMRSRNHKPRAIVLEDIDTIFHKRKNVTKTGTVAFETLLNLMDGVDREDGLVVFVTTNKVAEIDVALGRPVPNSKEGESTRPSRIDLCALVENPERAGRYKIAQRILLDDVLAAKLAAKHDGASGAQFQDACIMLAKSMFWKGDKR